MSSFLEMNAVFKKKFDFKQVEAITFPWKTYPENKP